MVPLLVTGRTNGTTNSSVYLHNLAYCGGARLPVSNLQPQIGNNDQVTVKKWLEGFMTALLGPNSRKEISHTHDTSGIQSSSPDLNQDRETERLRLRSVSGASRESGLSPAQSPSLLPDKFQARQERLTSGIDFEFYDSKNQFSGMVEETAFSMLTPFSREGFRFSDKSGTTVAHAYKSRTTAPILGGVSIEITDKDGKKIGSVEEEVIKGIGSLQSHYTIRDKEGKVIANSVKSDFLKTSVEIRTPEGTLVAKMQKNLLPAINGLAQWSLEIPESNVDPRLVVFIPNCITKANTEREKRAAK
jgi:hypothetical protein